jgi:hypothetical protein
MDTDVSLKTTLKPKYSIREIRVLKIRVLLEV